MPDNNQLRPEDRRWHLAESDALDFFSTLYPPTDPTPFMLLKGHLLIERHLKGLIAAVAKFERWTPPPDQTLVGLLITAEERQLLPRDLGRALKRLNEVRNEYAHTFEDKVTRRHIDYVAAPLGERFKEEWTTLREEDRSVTGEFRVLLMELLTRVIVQRMLLTNCGTLCTFRTFQKQERECRPIFIPRRDVERSDISASLDKLNSFVMSKEILLAVRGRLRLVFEGSEGKYADMVTDEKIRQFVAKLDNKFPYWFFCHELDSPTLLFMCKSLSSTPARSESGEWRLEPDDVKNFCEPHLMAMQELCERFDLEQEANWRTEAVMRYFGAKRKDQ